jgi:hypothetical protein
MTKILTATALAASMLAGAAHAGIEKIKPEMKAVIVTIMAIYEDKCETEAPPAATVIYKALITEQAYTEKQVKTAIANQAAFIAAVGQGAWCRFATKNMPK